MNEFPPFHPDWLVTFWYTTPILKAFDPHLFLSIIAIVGITLYFTKRRNSPLPEPDLEEQQFHHSLKKKQIIEQKIAELEIQRNQGELNEDQYLYKLGEYKKHLEKVKKDLLYFT